MKHTRLTCELPAGVVVEFETTGIAGETSIPKSFPIIADFFGPGFMSGMLGRKTRTTAQGTNSISFILDIPSGKEEEVARLLRIFADELST